MFGKFGRKGPQQLNLMITPGRRILEITLPVDGGYQKDEKAERAWGFSSELLRETDDGDLIMLLSADYTLPLWVEGEQPWEPGKVQDIIREAYGKEMGGMDRKNRKNMTMQLFQIAIIGVVILIVVAVIAGLIQSGMLDVKAP